MLSRLHQEMLLLRRFEEEVKKMAGKKDQAVVAVIAGLTSNQAAQITKDIIKSKQKNAALARGTVSSGVISSVSSLLQKGHKQIGGE